MFYLYLKVCGQGNYSAHTGYWSFKRTCKKCPIGTYNDIEQSYSCKQCPDGTTTMWEGVKGHVYCVKSEN